MCEWARRAVGLGFAAVKLEATFSGPYRHRGIDAPDEAIAEVAAAVRAQVGPEVAIMVDVQYAFDTVDRALRDRRAAGRARHLLFGGPIVAG